MMKTSFKGLAEIASHEAIVTTRYKDSVGVWTIGIGHTSGAGAPNPVKINRQLSITEVMGIFARDIKKFEKRVNKAFTRDLTQAQFDAAVSFDFNTGGIHRASWVKAFNQGDDRTAQTSFMKWRKPREIIPRRQAECDLFFKGRYKNDGRVSVYTATSSGNVKWSSGKRVKLPNLAVQNEVDPTKDQTSMLASKSNAKSGQKPKPKLNPIAIIAAALGAAGVAFWDKIQLLFQ